MKKTSFFAAAISSLIALLSISAFATPILNEIAVNPAGTDQPCEYFELRGTPGEIVENTYFVSVEGDSTKGVATAVVAFGSPGVAIGSNGLLVVVSATQCGTRTYPSGTTVAQISLFDTSGGALQNGSNSFLLVSSPTPLTSTTDYDTNDDGILDLPAGAVLLDSIAWSDGGTGDIVYGAVVTMPTTPDGGFTRFPNDTRPNLAYAWYAGALFGTNDSVTYSTNNRTGNFPADGVMTPGDVNVGTQPRKATCDMNGDGRSDFVVVRAAGGAGSQLTWYTKINGGSPDTPRDWGVNSDIFLCGDYDGDGRSDVTIFRQTTGTFYILQSATLTLRTDQLGQSGDDPTIVGDYDGDGKDDPAVYREGPQSVWYYRTSPSAFYNSVAWGTVADSVAPGDYDGDRKADFVVKRDEGGNAKFYKRLATGTIDNEVFGLADDGVVPGDYDGDGRTDLAVIRVNGSGFGVWDFEPSGTPGSTLVRDEWGVEATDWVAQGDYNGDGTTDYCVWRETNGTFYAMTPISRNIITDQFGQLGDLPAAGFNIR